MIQRKRSASAGASSGWRRRLITRSTADNDRRRRRSRSQDDWRAALLAAIECHCSVLASLFSERLTAPDQAESVGRNSSNGRNRTVGRPPGRSDMPARRSGRAISPECR